MRLIDADALDRAFTMLRFNDDKTLKHWGDRQDWCMSGQEVEDLINSVPTIETERKTGEWLPDNRPGGGFWVCSKCKFPSEAFAANVLYKFCPNCGASMGGDAE